MQWPHGYEYTGDWLNDKRTGSGTFSWADKSTYKGDWLEGKRDG